MNKTQKKIIYGAISIMLSSLIVWIIYGRVIFTKTQVLIEKKDELFPDMVQKVWVDKFIWGLDLSAALSGVALVAALILVYLYRTKKSD